MLCSESLHCITIRLEQCTTSKVVLELILFNIWLAFLIDLQEEHKHYTKVLEQMTASQKKCVAHIAHHRYRIRRIMESLKKYFIAFQLPLFFFVFFPTPYINYNISYRTYTCTTHTHTYTHTHTHTHTHYHNYVSLSMCIIPFPIHK